MVKAYLQSATVISTGKLHHIRRCKCC